MIEGPIKRGRCRAGRRDFGTIKADGTPSAPSFSVRWYEEGKQRRKRGLRSRTEAEAFLARVRTALTDGVLEAHRKSQVTLAVVADEWLRNHSAVKLRSHADNVERLFDEDPVRDEVLGRPGCARGPQALGHPVSRRSLNGDHTHS